MTVEGSNTSFTRSRHPLGGKIVGVLRSFIASPYFQNPGWFGNPFGLPESRGFGPLETMEDLSHFFPSMSLFQDLREALRLEPPRNACVEFPVNILNHIGHCGVVLKKLLISFERRMVTRKLLYRGIVTRGVDDSASLSDEKLRYFRQLPESDSAFFIEEGPASPL
jgi:hypothetical protein